MIVHPQTETRQTESMVDFEDSCAAVAEALASDPAHDMSLEQCWGQFEQERQTRRRITVLRRPLAEADASSVRRTVGAQRPSE